MLVPGFGMVNDPENTRPFPDRPGLRGEYTRREAAFIPTRRQRTKAMGGQLRKPQPWVRHVLGHPQTVIIDPTKWVYLPEGSPGTRPKDLRLICRCYVCALDAST